MTERFDGLRFLTVVVKGYAEDSLSGRDTDSAVRHNNLSEFIENCSLLSIKNVFCLLVAN